MEHHLDRESVKGRREGGWRKGIQTGAHGVVAIWMGNGGEGEGLGWGRRK